MTPAETAETTTAFIEGAAIMLGAALLFVTLFRQLKLGATLGYIVALYPMLRRCSCAAKRRRAGRRRCSRRR